MKYSIWNIKSKFDTSYVFETDNKFLIGDIIKSGSDYFLIKDNKGEGKELNINIYENLGNLFSSRTIFFINFVSKYWYSYFFKFFHFYIPDVKYISKLSLPTIKREKKIQFGDSYICEYKNFSNYEDYLKMGDETIKIIDYGSVLNVQPGEGQNLFIFPDLWSLTCFEEKISFKCDIFNVNSTSLQRMKNFLEIKQGKIKNVLTTHAGVFQDWKNLDNIFVFYPYKWYYKNQQNPRYYLPEITKQIKFFYGVKNLFYII